MHYPTASGTYKKPTIKVKSDNYLNNDPDVEMMKQYADVKPVDVFGGYAPLDKSDANLKKTEECIRERFQLDPK